MARGTSAPNGFGVRSTLSFRFSSPVLQVVSPVFCRSHILKVGKGVVLLVSIFVVHMRMLGTWRRPCGHFRTGCHCRSYIPTSSSRLSANTHGLLFPNTNASGKWPSELTILPMISSLVTGQSIALHSTPGKSTSCKPTPRTSKPLRGVCLRQESDTAGSETPSSNAAALRVGQLTTCQCF